jgi:hypothetical protein
MRAERDTLTAMDAHERLSCVIKINGFNRASLCTFATTDAQLLFHDHTSALSLRVGAGWASLCTGGWIARQTGLGLKASG